MATFGSWVCASNIFELGLRKFIFLVPFYFDFVKITLDSRLIHTRLRFCVAEFQNSNYGTEGNKFFSGVGLKFLNTETLGAKN